MKDEAEAKAKDYDRVVAAAKERFTKIQNAAKDIFLIRYNHALL